MMKSKRRRMESRIKKHRPFEEAEQQKEKCRILLEDMILEILSRLPVKSLLRFMCVSKHWKTLITSHPFRKLHREKHTSSPPLLIASYNTLDSDIPPYEDYLITFDFFNENLVEKVKVPFALQNFYMPAPPYQSKLLCFVSLQKMKFYLYNPSTRQSFLLTNPSSFSSTEPHRTELGYIPSKDEYIMVHLVKLSNSNIYCEVLSNISISDDNFKLHYNNQWRSSTEVTMMFLAVIGPVVFVGGAFYWQVVTNPQNPKEDGFILSFEVEGDSFSTIYYPPDVSSFDARLLDINNELYLVVYPASTAILVMWKFSCEEKVWSRYWRFDFVKLFGFKRGVPHHMRSFRFELFIYYLKYHKGYEEQPSDNQVSAEMGKFRVKDGLKKIPKWTELAVHTNLFTL